MTEEEVAEIIAEHLRMGVAIEFKDWREPGLGVRRIVWVPGEPNGIAATIIKHVINGEVILELDGHEYWIRRKPGGLAQQAEEQRAGDRQGLQALRGQRHYHETDVPGLHGHRQGEDHGPAETGDR